MTDAMESLKPDDVRAAQAREGLDHRQRNRRRDPAFRRQGEWFFTLPCWHRMLMNNETTARA